MDHREKLNQAYALAFDPPSLNMLWGRIKRREVADIGETAELVDMAIMLHQALPDGGYSSQRALKRLAIYQARSKAFGMARFLRNIRKALGARQPLETGQVPVKMIRDIALPEFSRHPATLDRTRKN